LSARSGAAFPRTAIAGIVVELAVTSSSLFTQSACFGYHAPLTAMDFKREGSRTVMLAIPLLLAASTMGVDYGWQRTADGQWEYIVQVEPALLQNLAEGESIVSTMPAEMDGVRRVVLKVGTEALPRERMPEVRPGCIRAGDERTDDGSAGNCRRMGDTSADRPDSVCGTRSFARRRAFRWTRAAYRSSAKRFEQFA
jgi:hypothetical protein